MSHTNEYDDNNDTTYQPSVSLTPDLPRHRPREHKQRRLHRHERTQSDQPIHMPRPVTDMRGASNLAPPQIYLSPPPHGGHSPTTEIAILPGGGVEIPPGFRFTQADQGQYRSHADHGDGQPGQPRVLGGLGLGMFKGLKKLPAALARAGRGYKPRQDADLTPEDRDHLPIDEDVETYLTVEDEGPDAEARVREEQLLREYTQRRRMRRDRAYRHSERVRREPYVPAPQPVPLPGSHTPVPSAVGYSDAPPVTTLEAEQLEAEREALARAQERERARNVLYAAEAVKPPSSVSHTPTSRRTHHRAVSAPPPPRVFSRWTAERDSMGRRVENRSDGVPASSTSPLSPAGLVRLIQQIRDMPWVGERVAADYIPGGVRPSSSEYTSTAGYPASGSGMSYSSPARVLPPPLGQSWYAPRDNVLVLPEGVEPPPGFIPYPHPYMPSSGGFPDDRGPSASSHTHVDVEAPVPVHASGPTYVNGETYHYMPAEASATGQSYVFVPTGHGEGGRNTHASRRPRTPGG